MQLREHINKLTNRAIKKGVPVSSICNLAGIERATFMRVRRGENTSTDTLDAIEKAINELLRDLKK